VEQVVELVRLVMGEVAVRKLGFVAMGAVLLVSAACDSNRTAAVAVADAASRAPKTEAPSKPESYQASGPIVVENQVDVAAQREGVVAKILVDTGRNVHRGQLLAELDNRGLLAERDAAEADVHGNEANLNNWTAESQVLQSDYQRDQELWNAKLITAQQLEHSRYKVDAAKFQITRDQQNVIFAKAKLRAAETELDKTRVVAPFNGVVARRYVREGQKVALNDRLFWVTETAPLSVNFTLPQEFVGKLKIGDVVRVSAAGASESQYEGKVTLVSPVVDPSSGTIEVRAQVTGKPADLLPGMTVNVQVPRAR